MKHKSLKDRPNLSRKQKAKKNKSGKIERVVETPLVAIHPSDEYDPDFHPADYVTHCKEGHSVSEICSAWNLPKKYLAGWVDEYTDFRLAVELGADCFDAYWAKMNREVTTGQRKGNIIGLLFTQKTQCGLMEGNRPAHREITGDTGVEVDTDIEGE